MTIGAALADIVNAIANPLMPRWPVALPITAALPVILIAYTNLWVQLDTASDALTNPQALIPAETFDFIIVGAGSAGMVVARRLSQNTNYSVLLLEAGGEPSTLNGIPSMDLFLMNEPEKEGGNTFVYKSDPQEFSSKNNVDQKTVTTRGKMLGGSSSINFMMYVRGNKEDYNTWAQELGDDSWNYTNVLPFFKKSQDYNGYWPFNLEYHGRGGELNVATYDFQPGLTSFLNAAVEKGYPLGDYNGENQAVFSPIDVTTQDGWRESTYRAFYKDVPKRSNLVIRKYAYVTKVNFVKGTLQADSVTYERQGYTATVKARKEIILSAGAFQSPHILMHSGIGSAAQLNKFNISVLKDLPVGQNFRDHIFTLVGPFMRSPSLNPERDLTPQAAAVYLLNGTGTMAAPGGLAGTAFFQSSKAVPAYPDIQVVQGSIANYCSLPADLHTITNLNQTLLEQWLNPGCTDNSFTTGNASNDMVMLFLFLGRPKSFGEITLASSDPNVLPNHNTRYLSNPDDLEALMEGFKWMVDLFENTKAIGTPLYNVPVPGCEAIPFKSDDYYRCVITRQSESISHHVGSCAMGAVVNSANLTVIGTTKLRVIDASVIPKPPIGNTNAPVIMVGEKGAQMLLDAYRTAPQPQPPKRPTLPKLPISL